MKSWPSFEASAGPRKVPGGAGRCAWAVGLAGLLSAFAVSAKPVPHRSAPTFAEHRVHGARPPAQALRHRQWAATWASAAMAIHPRLPTRTTVLAVWMLAQWSRTPLSHALRLAQQMPALSKKSIQHVWMRPTKPIRRTLKRSARTVRALVRATSLVLAQGPPARQQHLSHAAIAAPLGVRCDACVRQAAQAAAGETTEAIGPHLDVHALTRNLTAVRVGQAVVRLTNLRPFSLTLRASF